MLLKALSKMLVHPIGMGRVSSVLQTTWPTNSPLTGTYSRIFYSVKVIKKKNKSSRELTKRFIDFKRLRVTGGRGGDGALSFLSLPCNEWAGPDGGDGGNGGHVILEASTSTKCFGRLKSLIKADEGDNGSKNNCHGKNATHTFIQVPIGTIVKDENQNTIADLDQEKDIFVAARGGAGGKGNCFFLSNENRAPTSYEKGAKGEENLVMLELRVMAQVGLVGFPNAGKSTLLRALSRARPKVASYPFTTLNPHVGMIEYEDYEQVAVADIPGLVKGAHLNYGLGHSFLRHIERCACLLYVLDLSDDNPMEQFKALQYELEQYQPGLSQRPHAVIGNKIDISLSKDNLELIQKDSDLPIFVISAKKNVNIESLKEHIKELIIKESSQNAQINQDIL